MSLLQGPRTLLAEGLHYAAASAIVIAAFTGLVLAIGRSTTEPSASEVDNAVILDLAPTAASRQPARDLPDGPEQPTAQASQAMPSVTPPIQPIAPPKPDEPKQDTPPPPPVAAVHPDAVLDARRDNATPQPNAPIPPEATADARAPAGSSSPSNQEDLGSDEGRPHASAQAITLWQKSLMQRLESARRVFGAPPRAIGTAKIAFSIDSHGQIAEERVVTTSGSAEIDRAALLLVRKAVPFPPPPPGSGERERSFVVPIRFR